VSIFNLVYVTIEIPLLSRNLRNVAANSSVDLGCWQSQQLADSMLGDSIDQ
jgi:hypothetical protein